jgi:glycerol-3-phosphate O-acyltransferase
MASMGGADFSPTKKFRQILQALFRHGRQDYPLGWPARLESLIRPWLKIFFSGIGLDPAQFTALHRLPQDAIVIYVSKYKSKFEYLFSYSRYPRQGLPSPGVAFDYRFFFPHLLARLMDLIAAGFNLIRPRPIPTPDFAEDRLSQRLIQERCGFLSLVAGGKFSQYQQGPKTDPLILLVKLQRESSQPIYLVPQLFFFGRKPHPVEPGLVDILFGSEQRPGRLRRLFTLFRTPQRIFIEISTPLNLQTLIQNPVNQMLSEEHLALMIRRDLLVQIHRHRQRITGPALKTNAELWQNLLTSPRLQQFMETYARRRKQPLFQIQKEALRYFNEIAAIYSPAFIAMGAAIVKWLVSHIFDGITLNAEGLAQVKRQHLKGPLIFIPCHKSHFDSMIMLYVLHTQHVHCPHIFTGDNLSFWPAGSLFRRVGAFFVRRSFKGAVFYAKVFSEYIHGLLEAGFNLEVYIEGTRSRSGKLMPPQAGMLGILLEAYKNGACEDLVFVPVFIGYDQIPEESAYIHEIQGGQKKPENIWQLFKFGKILKGRYGRIYLEVSPPLSIGELLEQKEAGISELSSKEINSLSRRLGQRILHAIDTASVVTPQSLVAAALLNVSRDWVAYDQLMAIIETYLFYLMGKSVTLTDTLILNQQLTVQKTLAHYIERKIIVPLSKTGDSDGPKAQFKIPANKRPLLEYYKNNAIGHFIPAAFTALLILEIDLFQFSAANLAPAYQFLQDFFSFEFTHDTEKPAAYFVARSIQAFVDDAILVPHPAIPDTYRLTSPGFRKLKLFASFLKPFFEAYWIVLKYLEQHPRNDSSKKERLKKIQAQGLDMYKREEIDRQESLSRIYYSNADDFFSHNGVKGSEDRERIEYYAQAMQKKMRHLPWR